MGARMKYVVIGLILSAAASAELYECKIQGAIQHNLGTRYVEDASVCTEWIEREVSLNNVTCEEGGCSAAADLAPEQVKTERETAQQRREIEANLEKGKKVIIEVLRLNDVREATDEIKLAMLGHAQVELAQRLLTNGRISMARAIIEGISADGTIITTTLKQQILDYIDSL
jgi:hypothetical protein